MIQLTAELRFWWRDTAPDAVRDWFFDGRRNLPLETRLDTYFDPGNPSLGIKRRGDSDALEIKTLVKDDVGLGSGLAGQLWVKGASSAAIYSESGVDISKRRFLRSLSIDGQEMVEQEHGRAEIRHEVSACTIELTAVHVGEEPALWWSLGLEASSGLEDAPSILSAIVDRTRIADLPLINAVCASYPQWLRRI
ncbi:hypothetical protein HFP57_07605 [Parasphingopyxis algicola]|uniref:hypothetical protein n=1 Tax=Parasphingopyxis algicola TaxID=2026624 RepID=UPI0015A11633|nr:hypothetical protein [Parasphingopyxis algicola]QLC24907.1 hypothetical protein HFP57_07605 [Parasphingopyxis algicola]